MVIKNIFVSILVLFSCMALAQETSSQQMRSKHKKEFARFEKEFEDDSVKPEKYSDKFKQDYWNLLIIQRDSILGSDRIKEVTDKQQEYSSLKDRVEALEYNEDELEKADEKVAAHVKLLNDKVYKPQILAFLDFITWQREATIKSSTNSSSLIMTNIGVCAGGSYGYRNAFYHFFADACVMTGYGTVAETVNNLTYRQRNVPYYGLKASPGAGLIVSSLGVEAGLKLPLVFSRQELDTPNQTSFPGYKVENDSDFQAMGSAYARWPFKKWFIQTEFGVALGEDLTFWNIGGGYNF